MLSIFFPKVCGICKKKINQKYTCEKCSNILQYTMKKELCVRNINSYVDKLISLFLYKDLIRDALLEFKFNGKAYISNTFAELMCNAIMKNSISGDLIIPVPIHRKRYKVRGYNQSELLSKFIAKRLKIKYGKKILLKVKNNLAQSTLDMISRQKNVMNVYKINSKSNMKGKKIILVDDIYTTGATVNECAKILKQNGVQEVVVITVAYAYGDRKLINIEKLDNHHETSVNKGGIING